MVNIKMKVYNMMKYFKHISPAAKASIVLTCTQMIQKGLALITSPIYTRILSETEYGEVSLFFSWHEILIIFTSLCLSKGVFNNGMKDFRGDRDTFTLSMYCLTFVSTSILGVAIILFCKQVYNFMQLPLKLIVYMFLLLAFESALSLWTVRNRFEYKYKATTIVTILIAIVSPLCGILGIYLFPTDKVIARIIGARNIFLIAYMIVLMYIIYKARGKITTSYWKYALKFNLPLLPHYLSLHVLNHVDRIMISTMINNAAAGIYSVAYNGAAIVKMFWTSINASLIPWTYEKCENKDYQNLAELTKVLVFGYSLICIGFMFLAPEIMMILAPSSYHEGIYIIPSVIAGVFFSSLYYIFANVVYYYKKPKYVMIASVTSAILNVVLNAILIPIFGYFAAGYTTMISYIVQVIIDYWAMKKIVKKDIYDMKFIMLISFTVVIIGIVLTYIYNFYVVRMILFAIFLLYSIIYIRKNIAIFKKIFINKKGQKK